MRKQPGDSMHYRTIKGAKPVPEEDIAPEIRNQPLLKQEQGNLLLDVIAF